MIESILELLKGEEHLGRSEAIDIAKGKYKLETKFKEIAKQQKRLKAWR